MRTASGWYATSTSDDWLPAFPCSGRGTWTTGARSARCCRGGRAGRGATSGRRSSCAGRSRARLLRRAGEERPPLLAGASARRVARPLPRRRAAPLQPRRGDRPAPGHGRAGRPMAHLEARRQQSRPPHADPCRPAGTGRDVARRATAGAVPRRGRVGAAGSSRRPRCCATAATSTSSIRPGTAAAATATTRPVLRARRRSSGPGRSAAGRCSRRRRFRCPGHGA